MAIVARAWRLYHHGVRRGAHSMAGGNLLRPALTSGFADLAGRAVSRADGRLHGILVCPSEGSRPLAKSAVQHAFVGACGVGRWRCVVADQLGLGTGVWGLSFFI